MKNKSTSQSAFFNVRVLIGLFVFLAGVFPALVVRANPPIIETIPPLPGPPIYANFSADFIPADDGIVGIAFIREPSCIPTDFNLLLQFDVPAAFGCELTIEGKAWRYEATDPFPFQMRLWGLGAVPIYFVDEAELAAATQDGVLTIGELQALPSLLIGFADSYLNVIHNSNQGGRGKGTEVLNASGTILQSGLPFYFHYTEEFDPDTEVPTHYVFGSTSGEMPRTAVSQALVVTGGRRRLSASSAGSTRVSHYYVDASGTLHGFLATP